MFRLTELMMTRSALTLTELVIVLCILAALGGVLVPLCSDQMSAAASTTTANSLNETAKALEQYWSDTKVTAMDGVLTVATEANRFEIQWLFRNPVTGNSLVAFDRNTRSGWNGPYILTSTSDPSVVPYGLIDGWQHPITVQLVDPAANIKDVRVLSAGPNGVIDLPAGTATSALTTGDVGDDLYVALSLR